MYNHKYQCSDIYENKIVWGIVPNFGHVAYE